MDEILELMASPFNHPLFQIIGGIGVVLTAIGVMYKIGIWTVGIAPIVMRFGFASVNRKIGIFADGGNGPMLLATLEDSGLFKKRNIQSIGINDYGKIKDVSICLVDWASYKDRADEIFLGRSNNQIPIIIFAAPGSIPNDRMAQIANQPSTVVVNFRGRLLNDILTSLATASYDSK